jgi:hypothetical protein
MPETITTNNDKIKIAQLYLSGAISAKNMIYLNYPYHKGRGFSFH